MLISSPVCPLGITADPIALQSSWRAAAWERFCTQGLPHRKDEDWRYTPITNALPEKLERAGAAEVIPTGSPLEGVDRIQLTFVNGRFCAERSDQAEEFGFSLEAAQAELGTLATLDEANFSVVAHRGRLNKPGIGTFAALNTALFEQACTLRIPANTKVSKPIHVRFITSGTEVVSSPRVLIIAESGSEALVLETHESSGAARSLSSAVVEVFVASNAHVEHVKLQDEALDCVHVGLTEIKQEADSTYRHFNVCFGGKLTRNDINVFLNGSNVHCRIDGVICVGGDQHVDNHTRLDHAYPHCDSFEVYKHLLDGNAEAVFNGKIFVHQDAQKTDAKQTNNAILLSPTATMNTKPQLEIFADDVKCTHGATIGQMRSDAMFYLRSRGISEADSRGLLVYAFAAEVLEQISHEGVKEALEASLFTKLSSMR